MQLGSTFARFRLHSATGPGLHPGGVASKGEVEDHRVVITFDVNDPAEVAKLMASDAARDAYFGHSVAVSRDTAVIGAVGDRELGDYSGAAYVFTLNDGHWSQQAKLLASDEVTGDRFGYSVSVSGDTAVIGAYGDDEFGAAYVFTRSAGAWTQQAKLSLSDGTHHDNFGEAVSISGDTLIIGAWNGSHGNISSGVAYVYTRTDGVWTRQAKLAADVAYDGDGFGCSVSVSGDTAVMVLSEVMDLSTVRVRLMSSRGPRELGHSRPGSTPKMHRAGTSLAYLFRYRGIPSPSEPGGMQMRAWIQDRRISSRGPRRLGHNKPSWSRAMREVVLGLVLQSRCLEMSQ